MARPGGEENSWKRRWLLFVRAVVDRTRFIELRDVELVPLPEWSIWLGDFVDEAGGEPPIETAFEVTEDIAVMEVEPATGLSVPELGLYYIDGHWTIE